MCKYCDDWKLSGIEKRDFQHSKDGPEEIKGHPKRKSKRWCKNKEGREHNFRQVVWYYHKWLDRDGKQQERISYRWVCEGCGKVEWNKPRLPVEKHEHCYCKTHIRDWTWRNSKEIYEYCCICDAKGRSYKFYE